MSCVFRDNMETYVDLYLNADGVKASEIQRRLRALGLKPGIGEHDFLYDWNKVVSPVEIIAFADKVQEELKGTGVILRFTTIR
jgi:hypothetical protein